MIKTSVMGVGFVGGRYCDLYPDAHPEPREAVVPTQDDVLFLRSTTSNYAPLHGDFHTDIDTNLTHLMKVLPLTRGVFNFVSSWFVIANAGQTSNFPARETDLCDPRGFYSSTKLCAEHLVRSYCETMGKPYRILRLCNVIGNDPRANKQKAALEWLLGKVKRGEDVDVYDGDGYRAWLHVDDVARALRLCLDKAPLNEIVHIGPPRSERTIDLINHAIHSTGSNSRINLVAQPRFHRVVQTESFHFDTTKLRGLGFVPDMDAYQAVDRVVANMTL